MEKKQNKMYSSSTPWDDDFESQQQRYCIVDDSNVMVGHRRKLNKIRKEIENFKNDNSEIKD